MDEDFGNNLAHQHSALTMDYHIDFPLRRIMSYRILTTRHCILATWFFITIAPSDLPLGLLRSGREEEEAMPKASC